MRVWRVAHKSVRDGSFPTGPYTCSGLSEGDVERIWGMGIEHCDSRHPSPYADRDLQTIRGHERCGFDSRDALNAWFDGWTEALSDAGFVVWEYDVPDWAARVGKFGQVVFDADEAVEVTSYSFEPVQLSLFE